MTTFDKAFEYVILNEGEESNDLADRGGLTRWGITKSVAANHRCMKHMSGVDVRNVDLELAKHIYLEDYWTLSGIKSEAVAIKLFDMGVNFGVKTVGKLAQETANKISNAKLKVDGVLGKLSCDAINKIDAQRFLDEFETFTDDRYWDIIKADFLSVYTAQEWNKRQLAFGKGWFRRSNRRYYV